MARKVRQRISYVLPLSNGKGHRLGVNRLLVDWPSSTLYSAGRDGVLYAWDKSNQESAVDAQDNGVDRCPAKPAEGKKDTVPAQTSHGRCVQAHNHWINDISLVYDNTALVSASSDTSVKVWTLDSNTETPPQTIGLHSDYVKCLAYPGSRANYVAAGGLDRKICLWDLNGAGQKLSIDVQESQTLAKGSVYALAANQQLIASGGPESIVKLWDQRSGRLAHNFVGHTDNIRSILLSAHNDMVMTASADRTVKVWSISAARCMFNFTMHRDSVWDLYSNCPNFEVFYSADRSGLVVKTDTRGGLSMDQGLSIGLFQEQDGVNSIVCGEGHVWTATSSSSINRWQDVDTNPANPLIVGLLEGTLDSETNIGREGQRFSRGNGSVDHGAGGASALDFAKFPYKSILACGKLGIHPSGMSKYRSSTAIANFRKNSTLSVNTEAGHPPPARMLPNYTIEGQAGLIKHILLSDRRRVLSLDTSGEVMLWDLIQCISVHSYGHRDLDGVYQEVDPNEAVAHWCGVSTSTGMLTITLEENHCFDAEIYADELQELDKAAFREDQRLNLGKWVLKNLFGEFIREEQERDAVYRNGLGHKEAQAVHLRQQSEQLLPRKDVSLHSQLPGIATPDTLHALPTHTLAIASTFSFETGLQTAETPKTPNDSSRLSTEKPQMDYFNAKPADNNADVPDSAMPLKTPTSPSLDPSQTLSSSFDSENKSNAKEAPQSFSKRLRSSFTPGKKPARPSATEVIKSPILEEEAAALISESQVPTSTELPNEDSIEYVIKKIREQYASSFKDSNEIPISLINPPSSLEAPWLRFPVSTTVILQEDRPSAGGFTDLLEARVGHVGRFTDLIEKLGAFWVGDLLLRNNVLPKDVAKVSFTLRPYTEDLPIVTGENGAERLNANRMLRAKKIASYVAERLKFADSSDLKPEACLEIICHDQVIPAQNTLATIKTHIWRTSGDVALFYRSNDRRTIVGARDAFDPQTNTGTTPADHSHTLQ